MLISTRFFGCKMEYKQSEIVTFGTAQNANNTNEYQ